MLHRLLSRAECDDRCDPRQICSLGKPSIPNYQANVARRIHRLLVRGARYFTFIKTTSAACQALQICFWGCAYHAVIESAASRRPTAIN